MEVAKIKKIITAIGNPYLNNELNKKNNLLIINDDIQYQEGIFELLEIEQNIDYLILSELLPGNLNIEELIEKIKKINNNLKIILIIEKCDENKEKILINKGVFKILNNNLEINNIINLINENENMEKYNEEIRKEINELKKYIKKNKKEKKKILKIIKNKYNKLKNKIKKIFKYNLIIKSNNNLKNNKFFLSIKNDISINQNDLKNSINNLFIKNNKKIIISILGNNGSGKSVVSVMISRILKKYYKKILIIDFDVLNNSLHTILGVKKYSEKIEKILNINNYNKEKNNYLNNLKNNYSENNSLNNNYFKNNKKININNLIIKINKKIDLISGINLIFNNNQKLEENLLNNIFLELSEKYDAIIIDTSSECFFEYTKELIKLSDKCIFLTEPNLLEISKSRRFLDIYYNKWKIEKNKINIVFNKFNKNSIDIKLLKNIFSDYNILGKINLKNNYNFFINNNFKNIIFNNKIENNYKKIINKI